jgi:hypothetical protein
MKTELLMRSPLLALPLFALLLFLSVFLVMLVVTARRRAQTYEAIASLPLADDAHEQGDDR